MTIHRGRAIKVGGEPYTWRLSDKGGWYEGMSGEHATFTAQHSGAHGAMLRVRLNLSPRDLRQRGTMRGSR